MNKNEEITLLNFYRLVAVDSLEARKMIEQLDHKNNSYLLSCIALTYRDEAMFLKNGKRRKIFNKDKIDLAKEYIDKAFKLNPDCRDVLYIKGTIYNALDDTFGAMDCYIKILELGESLNKENNCSNSDLPYVKMVLNDSRFQLYRLFYDLENFEMSTKFLKEYKKYLKKGVDTIYLPLEDFLMSPR